MKGDFRREMLFMLDENLSPRLKAVSWRYDAAIDALWVEDRGGVFLDDVQSLGMGRGGGAAADSQLAVDVLEVGFDGIDGNAQRLCDFLVGLTVSEQAQNVEFAVAEWLKERRGRGAGGQRCGSVFYLPCSSAPLLLCITDC
jgi:hypothetical protein